MSEAVTHQMMMLRPMQAGLSGYARLQGEAGRQLVQINLRGMQPGMMRVFWYAGEGLVREVGRSTANRRGEASLSAEVPMEAAAPRRLMALLITDGADRPRPLAIGLCTAQSAGSLMDAKNALLALCDRLGREQQAKMDDGLRPEKKNASRCEDGLAEQEQTTRRTKTNAPETGKTKKAAAEHSQTEHAKTDKENNPSGKVASEWSAAASAATAANVAGAATAANAATSTTRNSGNRSNTPSDLPREVFLPAIEARTRPERRRRREEGKQSRQSEACPKAAPEATQRAAPTGNTETPQEAVQSVPPQERTVSRKPGRQAVRQTGGQPADAALIAHTPHATPTASEEAVPASPQETPPTHPSPKPNKRTAAPPADQLPTLQWPAAFQPLAIYFDRYPPLRLMDWPGWRFVHVPQGKEGLWIGYHQQDGRIAQVAYALPAEAPPPEGQPFRPARTADGQTVQLLVLKA